MAKKPKSNFKVVVVKTPIPVGSRKAFEEKIAKLKYPSKLKKVGE